MTKSEFGQNSELGTQPLIPETFTALYALHVVWLCFVQQQKLLHER